MVRGGIIYYGLNFQRLRKNLKAVLSYWAMGFAGLSLISILRFFMRTLSRRDFGKAILIRGIS